MNENMIVLIASTDDHELKASYFRFEEFAVKAVEKGLPFDQRVTYLELMETCKSELERRLKHLQEQGDISITCFPESLFTEITETKVRNQLLNGLYDKETFTELIEKQKNVIPIELNKTLQALLESISAGEYVVFWNVGELEANAIISN